jgi:hypothetical protein
MGRSLVRPCARICAKMSDILLVNREFEDFALKDRFPSLEIIGLLPIRTEIGEGPDKVKDYDEQLVVCNVALMKDAGVVDARIVPDHKWSAARCGYFAIDVGWP